MGLPSPLKAPASKVMSSRRETDEELPTMDLIAEARRPILIERHRSVIEEMESGIGDAFISGESENPRLKAMLAELEAPMAVKRLQTAIAALAEDFHYRSHNIRQALIDLSSRGTAVLVISQDLDELAEISDRIAVMFHGTLSEPVAAADATREKLGLLMGGASPAEAAATREVSHAIGA